MKKVLYENQREYYHSFKGWLNHRYHHMRYISVKRNHQQPKFTKQELKEWLEKNYKKEIEYLFNEWEKSDYSFKKSPSIDRLDDLKGYSLCNIRLVDFETNYKKSHVDMYIPVKQLSKNGKLIKKHKSISSASRETGVERSNINRSCKTGLKAGGYLWEK